MTIDDDSRGQESRGGGGPGGGARGGDGPRGARDRGTIGRSEITAMARPRSTTRDLERYAGLFASRTRVMKSSAMRDMMAITARPEVISLAGGLPDTSSFPPENLAAIMSRVAVDSCARALQYGPTDGLSIAKEAIARV